MNQLFNKHKEISNTLLFDENEVINKKENLIPFLNESEVTPVKKEVNSTLEEQLLQISGFDSSSLAMEFVKSSPNFINSERIKKVENIKKIQNSLTKAESRPDLEQIRLKSCVYKWKSKLNNRTFRQPVDQENILKIEDTKKAPPFCSIEEGTGITIHCSLNWLRFF